MAIRFPIGCCAHVAVWPSWQASEAEGAAQRNASPPAGDIAGAAGGGEGPQMPGQAIRLRASHATVIARLLVIILSTVD